MKIIYPVPHQELMPVQEIVEKRPVALVTNQGPWDAVKDILDLPITWKVNVQGGTIWYSDTFLTELQGEVIYTVDGRMTLVVSGVY